MLITLEIVSGKNPLYWLAKLLPKNDKLKSLLINEWNNDQGFEYELNFTTFNEVLKCCSSAQYDFNIIHTKLINLFLTSMLTGFEIHADWGNLNIKLSDGILEIECIDQEHIRFLTSEFADFFGSFTESGGGGGEVSPWI